MRSAAAGRLLVGLLTGLVVLFPGLAIRAQPPFQDPPVKIGILHSQTGTMAGSEKPLIDAALLAVEEVNARGGVLPGAHGEAGHRLDAVVMDCYSDPKIFAVNAEHMITDSNVCSLFGCWTSASRKAVVPVLEQHDQLLWYPVQYEGEEQSPHVIYTGLAANQQLYPSLEWLLHNRGSNIFLVGSDYVYPRTANALARAYLERHGGQVAGEVYRPLGSRDFAGVVKQIRASGAGAVLNTINGDSNAAFFRALAAAGLTAEKLPVMSMSVGEVEVRDLMPGVTGHFATWAYFSSLNNPPNRRFLTGYRNRYGKERAVDDPVETAYWQVMAFVQALNKAHSTEPEDIRKAALGLILETPEGLVRIDPKTQHAWRVVRVGQVLPDGQFRIVWSSEVPVRPEPWQQHKHPPGNSAR